MYVTLKSSSLTLHKALISKIGYFLSISAPTKTKLFFFFKLKTLESSAINCSGIRLWSLSTKVLMRFKKLLFSHGSQSKSCANADYKGAEIY